MSRPLDMLALPLYGLRLIEASAGTGKTYTLANLYLRLLLERKLEVTEILVVTFTNAATAELRRRISQRLRAALGLLEGESGDADSTLQQLLDHLPDSPESIRQHLQAALAAMDEAAIFTIHGFAQRLLTEHAFETGAPFKAELIGDEHSLRRTAVEDFWRRRFYPAPPQETAWVRKIWGIPAKLLAEIDSLLGCHDLRLLPKDTEKQRVRWQTQWQDLCQRAKKRWQTESADIEAMLHNSAVLKQNIYRPAAVDEALTALSAWLDHDPLPDELPARFELLVPMKLEQATKKGKTIPSNPLFDDCGQLADLGPRLAQLSKICIQLDAIKYTRATVTEHKRVRHQLSYDDLLRQLDAVLTGLAGPALIRQVREQFPAAMIDEFQDTDAIQYRVFSRIYLALQPEVGGKNPVLLLIGDPKQAIYAFRGADIFTYFKAKRDAGDQVYNLTVNWRSSEPLVKALNGLFSRHENPFVFETIDFQPVTAAPEHATTSLQLASGHIAPLVAWQLPAGDKPLNKETAQSLVAAAVADEISILLNEASRGRAHLDSHPLCAGDMAVLVRNRHEAANIRTVLAKRSISSAYLSRNSVFATQEAIELRRLLRALSSRDPCRIRTALASDLLGFDAATLAALDDDVEAWEHWLETFQIAWIQWHQQGFMAMFLDLLQRTEMAHRLLAETGGERRLTNLLQLAELLAAADAAKEGPAAMMRWLDERMQAPEGENEIEQLHLESDRSLVQIVTIHASKGLQYPLVFLPFPWGGKRQDNGKPILFHDPTTFELCADLGGPQREEHLKLAEREQLAEDLRLLYVAFTRACERVYFSWGHIKGIEHSALSRLLPTHGDTFKNLRLPGLEIRALPPTPTPTPLPVHGGEPLHPRIFRGRIDDRWRVTSYSSLIGSQIDFNGADYDDDQTTPSAGQLPTIRDAFHFPRGARAGLFLHALLEQIDFIRAGRETPAEIIREQLSIHGFDPAWQAAIEALVGHILQAPLDATGLRLAKIEQAVRLDELEFHFPLADLDEASLNALLGRWGDLSPSSPRLIFNPVHGIMRGFIDLVFRYDNRYYLSDYKSNYLGDRYPDYYQENLARAMRDHRYDLQYLIYTLALHRFLRARLSDYTYERDFGGVYYLFLRGMNPADDSRPGVFHDRPDPELIEELDTLFSGRKP